MTFSLFKGTFESAACTFEHDGWVTTDLNRGQRLKWCPSGKTAFRWDVIKPALRDGDSSTGITTLTAGEWNQGPSWED